MPLCRIRPDRLDAHGVRPRLFGAIGLAATLALLLGGCALTTGSVDGGSSARASTVPIKVLKGPGNDTLIQVSVTIGDSGPYPFIVDTGASETLIARPLAVRLHLPRAGAQQSVSGVGGSAVVIPVAVSAWRVGEVALPKATVGSGAVPSNRGGDGEMQGLLGSDIWSQFGRITIDYNADTLTIDTKPAARAAPDDIAKIAISPWALWRRAA